MKEGRGDGSKGGIGGGGIGGEREGEDKVTLQRTLLCN